MLEVENSLTCPQCFIRPSGKHFTYFQCGHLLCSSCFASNKPKYLCTCCMKVSLVRYDGLQIPVNYMEQLMLRIEEPKNKISESDVKELLTVYDNTFEKLFKDILK